MPSFSWLYLHHHGVKSKTEYVGAHRIIETIPHILVQHVGSVERVQRCFPGKQIFRGSTNSMPSSCNPCTRHLATEGKTKSNLELRYLSLPLTPHPVNVFKLRAGGIHACVTCMRGYLPNQYLYTVDKVIAHLWQMVHMFMFVCLCGSS